MRLIEYFTTPQFTKLSDHEYIYDGKYNFDLVKKISYMIITTLDKFRVW